jgi:hypothetical protein
LSLELQLSGQGLGHLPRIEQMANTMHLRTLECGIGMANQRVRVRTVIRIKRDANPCGDAEDRFVEVKRMMQEGVPQLGDPLGDLFVIGD